MQTSAFVLVVLAAAASAAEPPAAPATPAPAPTPKFTESDVIPDRPGYDDAVALYELRLGGTAMSPDEQLARWLEANSRRVTSRS